MGPGALDVAIVGGGPAGLQAALVLARTRKRVAVFDDPAPPRNAASHGVHNFMGVEGQTPTEIRQRVWSEIAGYGPVDAIAARVLQIGRDASNGVFVLTTESQSVEARRVVLACGSSDEHPDVPGFADCWGRTIFSCPFCDGFENRDRRWGIVPARPEYLDFLPAMAQNWTSDRVVIVQPHVELARERENEVAASGVPVHRGRITAIEHDAGAVAAVVLEAGLRVPVGALHWTLEERILDLVRAASQSLGLELDDDGHVVVDEFGRTNVPGLSAAGDVRGWSGAVQAAAAGATAAQAIVHDWFD